MSGVVSVRCLALSFLPDFCSIPVVFLALSCHTAVFSWAARPLRLGTCAAVLVALLPLAPFFILRALERSSCVSLPSESGDASYGLWLILVLWPFSHSPIKFILRDLEQ